MKRKVKSIDVMDGEEIKTRLLELFNEAYRQKEDYLTNGGSLVLPITLDGKRYFIPVEKKGPLAETLGEFLASQYK